MFWMPVQQGPAIDIQVSVTETASLAISGRTYLNVSRTAGSEMTAGVPSHVAGFDRGKYIYSYLNDVSGMD